MAQSAGFCPLICVPACSTSGCPSGQRCDATQTCTQIRCDEPGALACPSAFRCAPAEAAAQPASAFGSEVADDTLALQRGCVRRRCDEPNGFACRELWTCAVSEATDGSGCVPSTCAETGRCSGDDFICSPTSGGKRPPGIDVHGCVTKNCAEGFACPASWTCDPLAEAALETGCVAPVDGAGGSGASGRDAGGSSGATAQGGVSNRGGSGGRNASGGSDGSAAVAGLAEPRGTCVDAE